MRKLICILLALLLLPGLALAEMQIHLAADKMTLGSLMEFTLEGEGGDSYSYALIKDGKTLFSGEQVPYAFGAYLPREQGEYTLRALSWENGQQTEAASASFWVTSFPQCTLSCRESAGKTGEPLTFLSKAQGGVEPYIYEYAVMAGTECIFRQTTREESWQYIPGREGNIQVVLTVKDQEGNIAQDDLSLLVAPGRGISVSGSTGAFYAQGGRKTWIVNAPGVWTAKSNDDFIHISPACGESGDELTLLVDMGEGAFRKGSVTIACGDFSADFPVAQSAGNGMEEEMYLDASSDYLCIEGKKIHAWHNAQGEKRFEFGATGAWEARAEGDFISVRKEEGALAVTAEENALNQSRTGLITLSCGSARAYLYVFQDPLLQGADVEEVFLDETAGKAYEDAISGKVITSRDASSLFVTAASWGKPLAFSREQAVETEKGLQWEIEIPLRGSGSQVLLFSAENEKGAREKKTAEIFVEKEAARFHESGAEMILGEKEALLSVRVTAATEQLDLLDASGALLSSVSLSGTRVDRCLPGDETGRYARWEISLAPDTQARALRLGNEEIPIEIIPAQPREFVLYSQCDGFWKDKPYRYSTLEHSGCAIFALAHALQMLGYEGEEITPQALADTYAFCLLEGGTMNSTLIGHAGDDFGFKTRYELYHNLGDILSRMDRGAVYSFGVVSGHIAMVAGVSEDKTKFRIIDSAPSATLERIKGGQIYYQNESGAFVPVSDLADFPGSVYYIETNSFGGLEYYLDAGYVSRQGVRLILPEAK